ncbi:MAG: SDR family oxidoreductase [Desulfobacterales bacterium]|jgi:2-keto-3-deoxy-L-fuconate dehydrogenase
MAKRLDGQTAIITGAGQGIGRAIVHSFAREGSRVWATSRSLAPLQSLEKTTSVRIEQLDVTRPADVAAAAQKIGTVDILVNCAGYVASGTILDCSLEELERSLDVNLRGAVYMTRAFLPGMCTRGAGSIINIASVLSSVTSAPGRFAYSTAKAALIGFTKSVAVDFVTRGIRVNAVCPGAVQTPGLESRIAASEDPHATRAAFVGRHKMGRLGTVEEVAAACLYLASAESSFMTGQMLVVDGGMTL